ncbi:MAG: hypothetical protein SGILL_004832, partial [Bacillariaceae sp.]
GRSWVNGSILVAMPEDATYLSEIQQWTRQNMEFFSVTKEDAGKTTRVKTVPGRVGIRCIHCARAMQELRKQPQSSSTKLSWPPGAVSYPVNFGGVYSNSIQKPQTHFERCPYLPADSNLAQVLERSRASQLSNQVGSRKRNRDGMTAALYWTICCRRVGMVETNDGIRFGRDLALKPLPFDRARADAEHAMGPPASPSKQVSGRASFASPDRVKSAPPAPAVPARPIEFPKEAMDILNEAIQEVDSLSERPVLREDHGKITHYMFLALKQAIICHAGPPDFATRGLRAKNLRLGYAGLACRHCDQVASTSSCRKFSSSSDAMGCAIGSAFVPHLLECPYVPRRIQHALQIFKRYHSQQQKALPYGSQRTVYVDIWNRIRASDKDPDPAEEQLLMEQKQAARDDPAYLPDGVDSRGTSSRRGKRRSLSDSDPIIPRGPSFPVSNEAETQEVLRKAEENWDPTENDNLLLPEDKDLISDYLFLCVRQLKVAMPESSDFRVKRRSNLGSMAGLCCIHCADNAERRFVQPGGRTFVTNPDALAGAFNSSLYNHFMSCPGLSAQLKGALQTLRKIHSKQCSSLAYGSQRRFFQRVFNRLNDVPVKNVISMDQEEEVQYTESLRECAFVHRKGITGMTDFWQCLNCRMVPFEYRATGSLFFVRPAAEEMQRHSETCAGNDMCWDLVLSSMSRLNEKYGAGSELVGKKSFRDLVRSVVGADEDVVSAVLAKLGKADEKPEKSSSTGMWCRLPMMVDIETVQEAYARFKSEVQSEMLPDDFFACPNMLEFLQLLNCNFQPPRLPKSSATSVEYKAATSAEEESNPKPVVVGSVVATAVMQSTSSDALNVTTTSEPHMPTLPPATLLAPSEPRSLDTQVLSPARNVLPPNAAGNHSTLANEMATSPRQRPMENQLGAGLTTNNVQVNANDDGQFDDPE